MNSLSALKSKPESSKVENTQTGIFITSTIKTIEQPALKYNKNWHSQI
jgi:hypothetical protein